MNPVEREVSDAEERLRAAMLTNDVAALADLLHEALAFTAPDGVIVRKQEDLEAHAARRLRLTTLDFEHARVEVDGLAAPVTVRAILAGTFDGTICDGVSVR